MGFDLGLGEAHEVACPYSRGGWTVEWGGVIGPEAVVTSCEGFLLYEISVLHNYGRPDLISHEPIRSGRRDLLCLSLQ